jgi:hypothetical protein
MLIRRPCRRRRSAAPLSLAIVDHDTKRFTIEGAIVCEEPWVVEIFRANKAGRNIAFSLFGDEISETVFVENYQVSGYEEWPPKSIILI